MRALRELPELWDDELDPHDLAAAPEYLCACRISGTS
jgi:hypothetical protein